MDGWSHDIFDQDDAADWVFELEESSDLSAIHDALNAATDDAEDYMDISVGAPAVAAAEVVASLSGNPAADLPDSIREWIAGKSAPDAELNAKARNAITAVLAGGELKDLWQETDEYSNWVAHLKNIESRIPNVG